MMEITMEPMKLAKQTIEFQKSTFDNTYDAMITLQEQAEKVANTFLDQAAWIPKEGRDTINEWLKAYNKACKDYKKTVDDGFDTMGAAFAG